MQPFPLSMGSAMLHPCQSPASVSNVPMTSTTSRVPVRSPIEFAMYVSPRLIRPARIGQV